MLEFGNLGSPIWGLGFRFDQRTKQGRLFYAAWSSPAFGNLSWSQLPEDEKRNSIWSVRIANDGSFDVTDVRREFLVPDFFVKPEDIARAGFSQPVSDISFAQCGDQNVMLLAERGGLRNLGLAAEDAFATPHESRALRFEVDSSGAWRAVGRYDVGFYDRRAEGAPFVRANCSGGVAFGYGYTPQFWSIDRNRPNDTVWITGDSLCSPAGPCIGGQGAQQPGDTSQVHGIQGTPQNAFEAVSMQSGQPAPGSRGLLQSYLVDTDNNIGPDGQVSISELMRNDASLTGDIAIYEPCVSTSAQAGPPAPPAPPPFTIRKTQVDAVCPLGQPCTFDITLTNPLATPWSGIPRIVDVMPPARLRSARLRRGPACPMACAFCASILN